MFEALTSADIYTVLPMENAFNSYFNHHAHRHYFWKQSSDSQNMSSYSPIEPTF